MNRRQKKKLAKLKATRSYNRRGRHYLGIGSTRGDDVYWMTVSNNSPAVRQFWHETNMARNSLAMKRVLLRAMRGNRLVSQEGI